MTERTFAIICLVGFVVCLILLCNYYRKQRKSRTRIIKTGHMIIEIRPKNNDDDLDVELDDMYRKINRFVKEKENQSQPR